MVKITKTTTTAKKEAKVVKKRTSLEVFNSRGSKMKAKSFGIDNGDVVVTTRSNGQNPLSAIKIAIGAFYGVDRIVAKTPKEFIEEIKSNAKAKVFEKTYGKINLSFLEKMVEEKKHDTIITMNLSKGEFKQEQA